MRRFKVYTRNYGENRWREAHRAWTRNGAERWAIAHKATLLALWKVDTKR